MLEEKEIDRFKIDCAKISGQYQDFLVIVKTNSGRLLWKATDSTWATGACHRYLSCRDEIDRIDEQIQIKE